LVSASEISKSNEKTFLVREGNHAINIGIYTNRIVFSLFKKRNVFGKMRSNRGKMDKQGENSKKQGEKVKRIKG